MGQAQLRIGARLGITFATVGHEGLTGEQARIQAQRGGHPAKRHFTIRRILGGGGLWVSECVITYDGVPTHSLSVRKVADLWHTLMTEVLRAGHMSHCSGSLRVLFLAERDRALYEDRLLADIAPLEPQRLARPRPGVRSGTCQPERNK